MALRVWERLDLKGEGHLMVELQVVAVVTAVGMWERREGDPGGQRRDRRGRP